MPAQILTTASLQLPRHSFSTLTSAARLPATSTLYADPLASTLTIPPPSHPAPAFPIHDIHPPGIMNATYQQSSYPAYDSHGALSYSASLAHQHRSTTAPVPDLRNHPCLKYPPLQPPQHGARHLALSPQARNLPTRHNHLAQTISIPPKDSSSCPSTQPPTPTVDTTMPPSHSTRSRQNSENTLIFHSLQIPKCISPAGGNLADFAAQMTCLFWFQSMDDLNRAEAIRSIPSTATLPQLSSLAKPHDQFRKWVLNVLQTTQVTQNVILLALLFIYRLKMSTPQIKGRAGSEYRLLTVALMLGNKCTSSQTITHLTQLFLFLYIPTNTAPLVLDDNTYTNKTWADVSCFSVQEIHVMEVEFLSNMRYNLLASKQEWEMWLIKLSCFHEYYERTLRQPASPLHLATSAATFQSPTSPKVDLLPLMSDLPPYTPTTVKNVGPSSSHSQDWTAFQAKAISPLASKPVRPVASRKRSPEYDAADHPAKRQMPPQMAPCILPGSSVYPPATLDTRPPIPQRAIVASQAQTTAPASYPAPGPPFINTSSSKPLPPLQLGLRTIPNAAAAYQHQATGVAMLPQQPQQPQISTAMASNYPTSASATVHPPVNLGTPSKRRSPSDLVQLASSPMTEAFGSCSAMHTPLALTPLANSPSIYLEQRASPYKPIRHVNRLLAPPSSSLDQYHLSMPMPPNQIHYQPLGRRNDVRTGVVPEFVMYNQQQQLQLPQQNRHQGVYP